jgi:multiple sugar transport system substrate-binding protein
MTLPRPPAPSRLGALGFAACAALACACAPRSREVVFWEFFPVSVMQPILDKFERENPAIRVKMEQLSWQSGPEKIHAATAAGSEPDLCEMGSTWMPSMLASGGLADWSAGVADLKSSLRGWEMASVGDAIYGLPWVVGTRALFYNKSLFARAGLDSTRPPETWSQLREAAESIQKLGGGVHGFGVQAGERNVLFKKFMPFAWGNGGTILSDDLRTATFDSPENREALDFYLSLREVGIVARQDTLDRAFKDGRLGLEISGSWLLRSIPRSAAGLHYGVALVPRPDDERGTHASFAGGEVLVSFQHSRHKAEALTLARFLVRPDNAFALATAAQSVQPAAVAADTFLYYREHPGEQMMIRQFETAVPTPNHPAWVDMEAAIEDEVENALRGKPSAQAIGDAQRKLTQLLAKSAK